MKNEICLCVFSLIYSLAVWLFLFREEVKEKTKIKVLCKKNVYVLLMLIILCSISIELEMIYTSNTFVDNFKLITLLAILFVAAYIDYTKLIIPNKLVLIGIASRMVFYIIELFTKKSEILAIVKNDALACLIVVALFIIGVLIVKNGIGMGDIKLIFVLCIYQGFTGVMSSLFISLFVAFFISIFLLVFGKKSKKDVIPFAPSILIGTIISVILTGM